MFDLFRNRNFSLLWLAGLISMIGNWMLIAALPFHVYEITGSALATGGWLMAYIAPGILFGSIGGVFADRIDRRRLMIIISMMQAVIVFTLLTVNSPDLIWLVYLVGFLEATLGHFFGPAEGALLPTLVEEDQLMQANSLNALNDNLARILGPAIGGLLLASLGLQGVVLVDGASYLAAALLIFLMRVPAKTTAQPTEKVALGGQLTQVWRDWAAGMRHVANSPRLVAIFIVAGVALFGDSILSAVLVVFIQDDLGMNASHFGYMLTARGLGGFVGGLLIAQYGKRFSGRQLAGWGLVASGALLIVMLRFPSLPVLITLVGLVGLPVIAWMVAFQTLLQQSVEDKFMGRIFGTYGMTASLLMLVGTLLGSLSADLIGAGPLVLISASIYIFSGLLAFWLLNHHRSKASLAI